MKDVDVRVQFGLKFGKSHGFVKAGSSVVVVTGWRQGSGFTNTLRILYVDIVVPQDDDACSTRSGTDSYEYLL